MGTSSKFNQTVCQWVKKTEIWNTPAKYKSVHPSGRLWHTLMTTWL